MSQEPKTPTEQAFEAHFKMRFPSREAIEKAKVDPDVLETFLRDFFLAGAQGLEQMRTERDEAKALAEKERKSKDFHICYGEELILKLERERDTLTATLARCREDLRKYGRYHLDDCPARKNGQTHYADGRVIPHQFPCTCGLTTALIEDDHPTSRGRRR